MSEPNGQDVWRPGQDCQAVATAKALGQDVDRIHEAPWAVVGTLGDSICYVGVNEKVEAVHAAMGARISETDLPVRLLAPDYSGGISDGQRNGTPQMRYSLIGRETTNDGLSLHFEGSDIRGLIAVVACDKPPVGATRGDHGAQRARGGAVRRLDPPRHRPAHRRDDRPGAAASRWRATRTWTKRERWARNACPGYGSCGGMFTYNTMQSFIALLGLEPLHMVSPASEDPRRTEVFPEQVVDCLEIMTQRGITPRDIATPAAFRNATIVAIAMGGSTNVVLHAPEIARAAGIDFWNQVMSQEEFNQLSRTVPVLINARPFGKYSMVDIDAVGGLPVVVKELLDAGVLDGSPMTCTGETLAEQVARLDPPAPDGEVVHPVCGAVQGDRRAAPAVGQPRPGRRRGAQAGRCRDRRSSTTGSSAGRGCSTANRTCCTPSSTPRSVFADQDMVVIRYEGPRGAPGMPEMLDPTSRITTLCRQKGISVALMTDARFSGGSVGLVIGHVGPEAALGGPIALIEDGDTIVIDLDDDTLDCVELDDADHVRGTHGARGGTQRPRTAAQHPLVRPVTSRLLRRMRAVASPAIAGGGMATL